MIILLKHTKFSGSIIFTFDDKQRCVAFKFDCETTDELWNFIFDNFPTRQEILQHPNFKNFQKIEVPADLSFTAFWNSYNYKVGNKERARKLYELLDDNTRTLVLSGIKRYSSYLASRPNMEKAYAETFLNQRRWENSFD